MIIAAFARLRRVGFPSSPAAIAYLATALVLLVGSWQIHRARDAALLDADRDTQNLARSLAQHAMRSIETVDIILKGAVDQLEVGALRDPIRFQRLLAKKTQSVTQVTRINILDERGVRLASSDAAAQPTLDLSDREYFAWHGDSGNSGLYLGSQFTTRDGGHISLPLSRRWNNPDGSFGGVVVALIDPRYFANFYDTIGVGAGGAISLISTGGRYLVRHPFVAEAASRNLSGERNFQGMVSQAGLGTVRSISPLDGRERIISFQRLGDYPIVLLAALAVDETLAPWRREALIESTVLITAALALIVLGHGLSRHTRRMLAAENARQASEVELREKSLLLEATLASMDQGLIVVSPGDAVEVCNPRARVLLDLPLALMERRPTTRQVLEHQLAADEFEGVQTMTPALTKGLGFDGDPHVYERRRPNGTVLEIRTMPMAGGGIVRTYTDVTARRAAEAALRMSEERYRQLAETTRDVITHLRLPDFARVYVSPSCRALFGCEPDAMLGQRPSAGNMHPDDVAITRAEAERLARGEAEHAQVTYRARHEDGRWLWVEAGLSLVRDDITREPATIVCSLRDVTERRRQAEELEDAKEQAEAAARAKAEFLASMSHEIRTPLNGVLGYTDLLLDDADLSEDQRRRIERIQSAGAALLTVVDDILDFSKIEAGQVDLDPQPFHLAALIDNATSIVSGLAEGKGLLLGIDVDPHLPPRLLGDQNRLRQILLNLLNNAIKFTAAGSVALSVECLSAVSDGAEGVASTVRFAVTDTGIGIPEDKQDRLFQRFSQVDGSITREFGGTGLGLAISKHLVELMGGEIGVESTLGRGSTIWFTAKLGDVASQELMAENASSPEPAIRSLDILLVEDIDINRDVACSILERAGHRVAVAADGAAAVAAVQSATYDLVLMDVQMPVMDGMTATRHIRSLPGTVAQVPIIAMTANVLPAQVAAFRAAGMNDHIGKPFKRSELLTLLARWASGTEVMFRVSAKGSPESTAILDREVYGALLDDLGVTTMSILLDKLRAQLVQQLADVAEKMRSLDRNRLEREAHTTVSTAGLMGFKGLSDASRYLEEACQQDGAPLEALAEQTSRIKASTVSAIDALLHELAAAA